MQSFDYLCIFMTHHLFYYTREGLGVNITRFEIRKNPKVYGGSQVPCSSETNLALQKTEMWTFLWNKYTKQMYTLFSLV